MEHAGIDGCRHQVIGCCDGVDVTSQMQVKLQKQKHIVAGLEF